MKNSETFNSDLYSLLRTRGYKPVPLDTSNQRVPTPETASVIQATFIKDDKEFGKFWVSIDDSQNLIVYYDNEQQDSPTNQSPGLQYNDTWTGFLKNLKSWAMNRQLSFELLNQDRLSDDMKQREFYKMKEKMSESERPKKPVVEVKANQTMGYANGTTEQRRYSDLKSKMKNMSLRHLKDTHSEEVDGKNYSPIVSLLSKEIKKREKMLESSDYPKKKLGQGNPYYGCAECGRSDPEINGDSKKHEKYCSYYKDNSRPTKVIKMNETVAGPIKDQEDRVERAKVMRQKSSTTQSKNVKPSPKENLKEVSKDLLSRYVDDARDEKSVATHKANRAEMMGKDSTRFTKHAEKRTAGIKKATDKISKATSSKLDEVGDTPAGKNILRNYVKDAKDDLGVASYENGRIDHQSTGKKFDRPSVQARLNKNYKQQNKRSTGIDRAVDRLTKVDETAYEKDLNDHEPRKVTGIYGANSKPFSKKFRNAAAMNKFFDHPDNDGNYDVHRVEKVNEGDAPPVGGVDTKGAGLGAGRSATTLESRKINRKIMKENMSNRIEAARLEGKSHGLKGQSYAGKNYEDSEEARAYHEGYKEGLDECYGVTNEGSHEHACINCGQSPCECYSSEPEPEYHDDRYMGISSLGEGKFSRGLRKVGHVASVAGKTLAGGAAGHLGAAAALGIGDTMAGMNLGDVQHQAATSIPAALGIVGSGLSGAGLAYRAATKNGTKDSRAAQDAGKAVSNYEQHRPGYDRNSLVNQIAKTHRISPDDAGYHLNNAETASSDDRVNTAVHIAYEHALNNNSSRPVFPKTSESQIIKIIMDRTGYSAEEARQFVQDANTNESSPQGDYTFESWDKQLDLLLKEGLSVSISKGTENPDSVSINATDEDGDKILELVKNAGLGIFNGQEEVTGDTVVGAPSSETNTPGEIEVVGDHDDMLSLMKRLSGLEQDTSSVDSSDEEGDYSDDDDYEDSPDEDSDDDYEEVEGDDDYVAPIKQLGEVETEDQQEFKVSEGNPPDSGAADTMASVQSNAASNSALATVDAGQDIGDGKAGMAEAEDEDKEEIEEDEDEIGKLDEWANEAGPEKSCDDAAYTRDIDFMTRIISGGLNKPKSTGQTTEPVIAGQKDRMGYSVNESKMLSESINEWSKLAGIKPAK